MDTEITAAVSLLEVHFLPVSIGFFVGLVILLVLLVASGFISGAEASIFSLSPAHREEMESRRGQEPCYAVMLRMLADPNRMLATILIANNAVNVAIVLVSTYVTDTIVDFADTPGWGFFIKTVIITLLLLFFGEIFPKILGRSFPIGYVRIAARPLRALWFFLGPLAKLMARSVSIVDERFSGSNTLSLNELGRALDITKGRLPDEDKILRRIVRFGDIEACEIMTPRVDVVAVDVGETLAEVCRRAMESGFSRLLVMQDDSLDRVMGIVHVKDLLPYIDEPDDFDWKRLVRKTFFVPERKKIDDLLTEFQANNLHMAVVVDEYGGTCGVVTLEDVMEEIFGEIEDETDDPERLYVRLNDRSYLFEGKVQINDFCKVLELRDDAFADVQGEAETLAGMMLEQLGRIPEQGESLKLKGLMFTAATVTARKIDKVRVDRVE